MTGFLVFVAVCLVAGSALMGVAARRGRSMWARTVIGLGGLLVAAAPVLMIAAFLLVQPTPLEYDETLGAGIRVERLGLTPDAYPEGMTSTEELSERALDLSPYRAFSVVEFRNAGASLPPAIAESAQRPGQFWFDEPHGWMTPEEARRAVDDGRMSTICMPAPEGTYGSVD